MTGAALIRVLLALGLIGAAPPGRTQVAAPGPGWHPVTFERYSPVTRSPDYLERVLSPLAYAAAGREASRTGKPLGGQFIDLSRERFALYVPARAPAAGYGVLVFIPPWPDARLPAGWAAILEEQGLLFVTAAQSGNEEQPLGRRAPLGLLGLDNVLARFPTDPTRIYVSGFSGGSRVALTLALDFPELFAGALLDAGSDPIGTSPNGLPPAARLARFQELPLVLLSGAEDAVNIARDADSLRSLKAHCALKARARILPWLGHAVVDGRGLSEGLRALAHPPPVDAAVITACRVRLQHEVDAALDAVEAQITHGDRDAARRQLTALDQGYGAFAAPRLSALAERCDCGLTGAKSR